MNRRDFLAGVVVAAGAAKVRGEGRAQAQAAGPVCFFSKHLPSMAPGPMARALRAAGYQGIELTVRSGGHVHPENVETDLPNAVQAIRAEGMEVPIIATGITSAEDKTARRVLTAAAKLGVRLFRSGWLKYASADVAGELARAGQKLAGLAELAKSTGVELAYQNHVNNLGAAVWDLARVLEPLDPRWAGVYYDIRHAVAEGTAGSWRVAMQLVASRIKVFSVKDFYWEQKPGAGWAIKDCPLGEGMATLRPALEILARNKFCGPITVFNEYLPESDEAAVLTAAARDLVYLRAKMADVAAAAAAGGNGEPGKAR